jgi:hypothetical protein
MDNEINIKIGAEDNFSATFKKVSESMNGLAFSQKTVQTTTEATTNSFSDALTELKALSNTAESFERIQSTIINTQLRLENAYTRVLNAQDRVQSATEDLQKAMSLYGKDSLEAADAQDKLERAQRQLTITENNQKRVQEQLWGTYLSIITSTIQLIGTLPQLIATYNKAAAAIRAMNVAQVTGIALMNPAAAIAAVAAVGMAVYAINAIQGANAEYQLGDSLDSTNPKLAEQAAAIEKATKELSNYESVLRDLSSAPLPGEKESKSEIIDQAKIVANTNKQIADLDKKTFYSAEDDKLRKKLVSELEFQTAHLNYLQTQYNNEYKLQHEALGNAVELAIANEKLKQEGITEETDKGFETRLEIIRNWSVDAVAALRKVEDKLDTIASKNVYMGEFEGKSLFMDTSNNSYAKQDTTNTGNTGFTYHGSLIGKNTSVGDAIIRPNGQIINTDPNDTIVALKDIDSSFSTAGKGQSIIINITGDNYGTDPNEIARVLYSKLRRRIAI